MGLIVVDEAVHDRNPDHQKNPTDWAERNRAWALYHEGLGPLPEPLPELAEPERTVTPAPPVATPVASSGGGQYDGLSWEFARACVKADREHAQKYGRPVEPPDIPIVATNGVPSASQLQAEYEHSIAQRDLPTSTRQAIDFLLKQNDSERLAKFLEGWPQAEVQKILAYIQRKKST